MGSMTWTPQGCWKRGEKVSSRATISWRKRPRYERHDCHSNSSTVEPRRSFKLNSKKQGFRRLPGTVLSIGDNQVKPRKVSNSPLGVRVIPCTSAVQLKPSRSFNVFYRGVLATRLGSE